MNIVLRWVCAVGAVFAITAPGVAAAAEASPSSPLDRPFAADPLHLVAHRPLTTTPPPTIWKVFTCDLGTGYYIPNPKAGIDAWENEVVAWFQWASQGEYRPKFQAAGGVTATTERNCVKAAAAKLTGKELRDGIGLIVLGNSYLGDPDCPANPDCPLDDEGNRIGNTGVVGWGQAPRGKAEGTRLRLAEEPYAVYGSGGGLDAEYRWSWYIHEMGHTLGWHHVPYSHSPKSEYNNPTDVMSGIGRTYTHPFNRYRRGWVEPGDVVFHTSPTQSVKLGPAGGGNFELLILPTSEVGKLYAVGVNPGTSWPIVDDIDWTLGEGGVEILEVDQSLAAKGFGGYCPASDAGKGACWSLGAATTRVAPSNIQDFQKHSYRPGDSVKLGDVKLTVEAQDPDGYTITLQGPVTPMWGAGAHSTKKTNSTKNTTGTDNHLGPDTSSDTGAGEGFTDTVGHTFATDILWLAQTGITKGCNPPANTRFCPNDSVTRGQMAAFLVRALKLPASGENAFEDTHSSVLSGDIATLAQAGITKGCNPPANTRFCPDDPVTRGQMAAFLRRALNLPGGKKSSSFEDTGGHVFAADVSALAAAGITKGCNPPRNDRFCPERPVTRGEMAAFLRRALNG